MQQDLYFCKKMITPKILNVGVYREAQKSSQTIPVLFLGLYVRGLIKSTSFYPDGTLYKTRDSSRQQVQPGLSLTPPGFHSIFEYGKNRENWVVMLAFPAIQFNDAERQLCWHHNGNALPIPGKVPLKEAEVQEMRQTFDTLSRLYHSSLPQNQLAAELLVLQILQNFLRAPETGDDLIERFRKLLEEDLLWEYSITEHCRKLNINRDLLRQEFQKRYKIAPGEYRIQMRLRKICHLLAYSDLNLKEIAYEVGMKNLSHLSSFVKEKCGKTPTELAREYRKK